MIHVFGLFNTFGAPQHTAN